MESRDRLRRRWSAAAAMAAVLLVAAAPGPPRRPADHVVLVSIDGLVPEAYLGPHATAMPNLQKLRASGSWAEGVVGQYPSLTYPSHVSMATGVRPARHGITQNQIFDPGTGSRQWIMEASRIKVRALWDVARDAGLTTAAISWPVTAGAAIDAVIPEGIGASTPGLLEATAGRVGFARPGPAEYERRDIFMTAAAAHVVRSLRPNLLLLHLVQADEAQHVSGRGSEAAGRAFAAVDRHLGELIRAVDDAGIRERTAIVVTGDHGFYSIHSALQPNVALRQAGLLTTAADGHIEAWQAAAQRAAIKLREPDDVAIARRVEALFQELADGRYRGIFRVVRRAELDALGADPTALLMLEPVEGYMVTDGFAEDAFVTTTAVRGQHGFLPTARAMHTGLVIAGAGVRAGIAVPLARQIDVAPTVARLLGTTMEGVDGAPMMGILTDGQGGRS
jgi:predicted AlkP superfamily pyrophosphatase or phosphodiesterase